MVKLLAIVVKVITINNVKLRIFDIYCFAEMDRLTDIQKRCLNIATKLGHHNLLILGKVGAGKMHLLR